MKKLLPILTMLFFYLGISIYTQAATKPVARLGAVRTSTNTGLELHPLGCSFSIPFHITVTNLGTFSPAATNGIETLPDGYSPMFLEYSIDGGPIVREPITEFTYVGIAHGIPIYESIIYSSSIDIQNQCITSGVSSFYSMQYFSRLVTQKPGTTEFTPYPLEDHTGACDIFSCGVDVDLTCISPSNPIIVPVCSEGDIIGVINNGGDQPGVLSELLAAPAFGMATIYCPDCSDTKETINETGHHTTNVLASTTVTPNPFSTNFEIKWSAEQAPENFSLYDTTGRLVKQWTQTDLTNRSKLFVDTNDFQTGVYFLNVSSKDNTKVIKIVKQ